MIRRLTYKPLGFAMMRMSSISKYQLDKGKREFDAIAKVSREPDVKFRSKSKLSGKEEEFVKKRTKFVFQKMTKDRRLKASLEGKDASKVPNIAIIGSGGGMRAVIGMSGTMMALEQIGILEYAMYTAGLSGSSWYLMSMYAYDKKLNPTSVAIRTLGSLENVRTKDFLKRLLDTRKNGWWHDFNLTREFGISLGDILLQEKSASKWSEQTKKLEDGSAPLPLIAALHVRAETGFEEYHDWIELSPYEVFIPKYGAAIQMENFGNEFNGGYVTKKHGEKPIAYLQGICGSAYATVRAYTLSDEKYCFSVFKPLIRSFFNYFDKKFVGSVPNWLRGITTLDPLFADKETEIDIIDAEKESMLLIDAGLAFNSPYPTVLVPSRKVDVILSFDFSKRSKDTEWPFKQLEKASKWAEKNNIPFPKVNSKLKAIREKCSKKGNYEEMYVFPGDDNSPTVLHFVMINSSFRKQKHGFPISTDFKIGSDYPTSKFGYSNNESRKLFTLSLYNVRIHEKKIFDCILSAIKRKK